MKSKQVELSSQHIPLKELRLLLMESSLTSFAAAAAQPVQVPFDASTEHPPPHGLQGHISGSNFDTKQLSPCSHMACRLLLRGSAWVLNSGTEDRTEIILTVANKHKKD